MSDSEQLVPAGASLTSEATLQQIMNQNLKEEVRRGRRCFTALERLTSLMMTYPPGHPIVDDGAHATAAAFRDLFEITDRLSVMIFSHTMRLLGTDHVLWETEEPRDYCWVLSRDGVYMLHFLAGVNPDDIRIFIDVINDLVDERDLTRDAVTMLFESGLKYISYDAIDESLAQLLNIEMDLRNRDTKEEQQQIEELIDQFYDKEKKEALTPEEAAQKQREAFEVRMQKRAERQQRIEVGSREFLTLSDEQQAHLRELKRCFTEHSELEHREGEILAAILGAKPKPALRDISIEQISEVMGYLLETKAPWECLDFLKLIHKWREGFDDPTAEALKSVVTDCFTPKRMAQLIKLVTTGSPEQRRSILAMFNALHLDIANRDIIPMLAWDLSDEIVLDLQRYLRERSRYGLQFIMDGVFELPPDKNTPLIEIAREHLPRSRPIFIKLIQQPTEPATKVVAVQALAGHLKPEEAKQLVAPLLRASNDKLRMAALRLLSDAAPKFVAASVAPLMNDTLREKPEEEVRELATLFVKLGGELAVQKMKDLIQVGKFANEKERDLALLLVKVLARDASPKAIEILTETAKDWKLHGQVRQAAQELVDILQR